MCTLTSSIHLISNKTAARADDDQLTFDWNRRHRPSISCQEWRALMGHQLVPRIGSSNILVADKRDMRHLCPLVDPTGVDIVHMIDWTRWMRTRKRKSQLLNWTQWRRPLPRAAGHRAFECVAGLPWDGCGKEGRSKISDLARQGIIGTEVRLVCARCMNKMDERRRQRRCNLDEVRMARMLILFFLSHSFLG